WVSHNERPFPCVCPTRNEDCVFAEVYYELSKVAEISNFEKGCEEGVLDFHSFKKEEDDISLLDWMKQYENLYSEVHKFDSTIKITKFHTPIEKLTIKVEFPDTIKEFLEIYTIAEALVMNKNLFRE